MKRLGFAFRDFSLKLLDFASWRAKIAPLTDFHRGRKQSAKCVLQTLSAFFDEEDSFEDSIFM